MESGRLLYATQTVGQEHISSSVQRVINHPDVVLMVVKDNKQDHTAFIIYIRTGVHFNMDSSTISITRNNMSIPYIGVVNCSD